MDLSLYRRQRCTWVQNRWPTYSREENQITCSSDCASLINLEVFVAGPSQSDGDSSFQYHSTRFSAFLDPSPSINTIGVEGRFLCWTSIFIVSTLIELIFVIWFGWILFSYFAPDEFPAMSLIQQFLNVVPHSVAISGSIVCTLA